MPFVSIALSDPAPSATVIAALQNRMTRLMVSIMGKAGAVTAVRIDACSPAAWAVGGHPATELAAHVEITVTAGTNTAAQMADLIAATTIMLKEEAAVRETASYVVIRECPATAWGYDGETQASRAARKASAP